MEKLHNHWQVPAILFGLWIAALAIPAFAQTGIDPLAPPLKVSVKELPKGLLTEIKKTFPNGKIIRAARSAPRNMDEGLQYLFITVLDGKQEYGMTFYGWGIVSISKVLARGDVPASVTNAIEIRHPLMTIQSAREIVADVRHPLQTPPRPLRYEVHIVTAKNKKLLIWIEPEVVMGAKGEEEPNGKMRITLEGVLSDSDGDIP